MRAFSFNKALILAIFPVFCTACTALTSQDVEDIAASHYGPEGTFYSLPNGVVPFELRVYPQNAIFEVIAQPVEFVPDKAHHYFLQYIPRANSNDSVIVSVSNKTFLKSITANVTDETANIILNLFRGAEGKGNAKLQAAVVGGATETLDQITIDPVDDAARDELAARFAYHIMTYVGQMKRRCDAYDARKVGYTKKLDELNANLKTAQAELAKLGSDPADSDAKKALQKQIADLTTKIEKAEADLKPLQDGNPACAEYRRLYNTYDGGLAQVDKSFRSPWEGSAYANIPPRWREIFQVDLAQPAPIALARGKPADCHVGACYRPTRTFILQMSMADGGSASARLVLPNASPLVALDISRAFLVQKITTLSFDDKTGLLTQFKIDKKSELLAASTLPIEVAKAILEVPAELAQLKVDYVTQQDDFNTAKARLAKAEGTLAGAKSQVAAMQAALQADQAPEILMQVDTFPAVFSKN